MLDFTIISSILVSIFILEHFNRVLHYGDVTVPRYRGWWIIKPWIILHWHKNFHHNSAENGNVPYSTCMLQSSHLPFKSPCNFFFFNFLLDLYSFFVSSIYIHLREKLLGMDCGIIIIGGHWLYVPSTTDTVLIILA